MISPKLQWINLRQNLHDASVAQVCIKTSDGQMQDEAMAQYVAAVDHIFADLLRLNDCGHLAAIVAFLDSMEAA